MNVDCGPPIELVKLLAIFMIGLYNSIFKQISHLIKIHGYLGILATLNAVSVTAANRMSVAFIIFKILIVLVIVVGGLVRLGQGL